MLNLHEAVFWIQLLEDKNIFCVPWKSEFWGAGLPVIYRRVNNVSKQNGCICFNTFLFKYELGSQMCVLSECPSCLFLLLTYIIMLCMLGSGTDWAQCKDAFVLSVWGPIRRFMDFCLFVQLPRLCVSLFFLHTDNTKQTRAPPPQPLSTVVHSAIWSKSSRSRTESESFYCSMLSLHRCPVLECLFFLFFFFCCSCFSNLFSS